MVLKGNDEEWKRNDKKWSGVDFSTLKVENWPNIVVWLNPTSSIWSEKIWMKTN